ncbi:T9SS type A sorting domain-containing protein [candidate division WOR-3 bacterium]|nr:T9SS type A sorting domain-containing protein [candidate division WOR-3 bacterium]
MGCIKPPNREFLHLRGIAIKDNGNIFALEAGTKTLWEFSNYGDSISALFIPMLYGYGDVEYNDGVVYIGNERNILTIEGTSIDSFCGGEDFTKHRYYKRISISDNGKIVVGGDYDEGGRGLKVFSSTGDFEAEIYPYPRFYDMIFYNNDIILCGGWDAMEINVYREFGKENGLIRAGQSGFKNLPPTFLFQGHDNVDVMNSGSISYQVPGNSWEEFMPLESFYGTDYIPPPVYINMQGDWQDSPVFYDCLFNLKVLNVFDSSIVKNGYDLNLSPFDNVPFADTIKDTIPTGDYCVLGKANSSYPQKITSDWKLFTVIGDDLTLLLKSDKEEGFVEDTFRINPITINPLPLEEDSLHLLIKGYYNESETTYVDTSFVLLAETTDSFPFIITPEEPLIIKAELIVGSSDTIRREFVPIITSNRMLALDIYASDIVDLLPFNVTSEVYNYSFDSLSVEVKRIFLSDTLSDSVNLEIEGFHTFVDTFITEQPGTLKIIASTGGVVFTEEKFIDFGMNGVVLLDSLYEVSPDSIEMSGIVSNAGLYPLECDALFCLVEDDGTTHETDGNDGAISIPGGRQFSTSTKLTATQLSADGSRLTANYSTTQQLNHSTAVLSAQRMALSSVHKVGKEMTLSQFVRQLTRAGVDTSFSAIYLSPGKTDTIPIMFNRHDVGDYDLLAFLFTDSQSFMFDSTSSDVNVVGDNQLFVDSLFVSENCDTNGAVRLTAVLDNRSFSPFSGNLTISSPICYLDSLVSLPLHSKDTLEFLLEDPVAEGTYTFTSIISEGGIPVSQKSQDIEFHPIYRFDSLPANLEVSTPDSGIIRFPVRNIGNAKGERNIRVNLADVISIDEYAVIEPAVSDTFINNFLIPEDFPGGEYFADAYILKNAYPEIDTFFNVKVNGLVIKAADSLDKLVYSIDDTADLSILIENQSLWSGDLLASLQYGELELDTSFLLGGMEKGVLNTTTDRDTLYLDTSGVYMFDPINSGSYDSVRINWNASLSDSLIFQMRTDSFIGRGNWITLERNGTYILDDWMQINFANKSPDTQWIDAICLYFNSLGCTKLDTFPPQREIVTFEVPVDSSQEKLGWGIYYPSGRSVVLDEKYIYLSDSLLTIFTDKARYEIFDTVHATLCKNFPDTNYNFVYRVYFSPTEEIWDTFVLARDTMNFSFVIPEWTRSGTYSIDYRINDTVLSAGGLQLSATFSSHKATKNTEGKGVLSQQNPNPQILNPNLTIQPFNNPIAKPGGVVPLAKQWVMGKPALSADGDSAFISGEHLFDVDGITVYFKNAKMDTNFYFNGEKAKIRTEIFSDIDIMVGLNISSTGSAVKDTNLDLKKDMPNKFEFEYPVENCRRGMNELYLHLAKDSMSLAGIVVYFDVYVSDSTAPVIFVLEKPTNTYSSNRAYQLMARIYGPDANGTPIHDTLYYRIASVGGSSWQALLPHSMRGDTHKYLIPSHPNGTHIEYTLIARDESDNRATYPEEGNEDFWVLSPLKPTWNDLTYLADTNAILTWNPPEEMVYYHCGLCSDTIDIEENTIATRFTTQCLPAVLKTIGLEIVKENGALSDTLTVSVYTVAGDSIPGTKTDSFEFTGTFEGYNEFDLTDIQIPENGIFIGVRGSNGLNLLLDGFGEGSHTAIDSNGTWNLTTSGELVIDGIVSHLPTPKIRGASEILTFDVFRSTEQSDWTKIASGLTSSTYTDESTQENQEYSYKIMASFGNPADSFLSSSREVFIDVSPPVMDSIEVNDVGENELVIWAALTDISGIAWDSLGYKSEETINMISEDSCRNNKYFFSLVLSRDTLEYFLKTKDASLLGNYVRYPANGFYKWGSQSGIHELIPDSTYLFRMSNVLVSSNIEIKYALSEESDIQIMFFDILGRKAKTLVDETKKAGYYSASVRSTELPQGIYFLRMKAGDYRKTLKLVKVR